MAERSRGGRIAGLIVKIIAVLLIVAINGIILWRVFSSGDPSSIEKLTVTDATRDAYEKYGDTLKLWSQEQTTITKGEDNYGYFSVTDWVYIEQASQLQLVFRYNNSTIKHLAEDYELDKTPGRADELYDVTLCIAYDLTPDNDEDNDGNDPASVRFERYHPTAGTEREAQKNVYNYRRFLFDGITIDDSVLAVYADIYYVGDIDYEKEAYGTLCLYDYVTPKVDKSLSADDKKALGN